MQKQFLRLLMTLAQASRFELSKDLVGIYDTMAERHGYDKACAAIERFLMERATNDPFPSPKDLLQTLEPTLLPEDQCRTAAARIIQAVPKFGRMGWKDAEKWVGELGWAAVKEMGGWSSLCAGLTHSNTTYYQSQLMNLALTIYRRSTAGYDYAPALPKPKALLR